MRQMIIKRRKKMRKIQSVLASILMVTLLFAVTPIVGLQASAQEATQPVSGTGDYDDPYQITSANELLWFAQTVNAGENRISAILMQDIDLSSICSQEIGNWDPISNYYSGYFNGNGYAIKNLYINNTEKNQGLFGIPDRATIKYLGVVDCNITGEENVGAIVANSYYTTVDHCYVTGTISGSKNVGGVYGISSQTTIDDVISAATVSGNSDTGVICGSLNMYAQCNNSVGIKTENIPLIGNCSGTVENLVESADLSTGEDCWFMNNSSSVYPIWYQNIGEGGDVCPVLDSTHGVVYAINGDYMNCIDHSNQVDGFCASCGKFSSDGLVPNSNGFYEIDTAKKLLWFSYYENNCNASANAILTKDIDLSTVCGDNLCSWLPIGEKSDSSYKGTFCANGKTISNLYIDSTTISIGLFGYIASKGSVSNLSLTNVNVNGVSRVGGVSGYNQGTISKCSVSGSVTSVGNSSNTGGVCGYNLYGTITNSCNTADVSIAGDNSKIGGICGSNYSYSYSNVVLSGTVTNCYSIGSVSASGESNNVGGIIGFNNNDTLSVIKNNYYLDTSETDSLDETTFETLNKFLSGEVTYLLNNGVTDGTQIWYQTCGKGLPALSGLTVYTYVNCQNETGYTNDSSKVGATGVHIYFDGICTVCGEIQTDFITVNSDGIYEISSASELNWFSAYVNNINSNVNAKLTADINMNGIAWTGMTDYSGTFDGAKHTISNLCQNAGLNDGYRPGFVVNLKKGGAVNNLVLKNADIFYGNSGGCGAVAGQNNGEIKNVVVTDCYIQYGAYNSLGGIVGVNNNTICNCAVINTTVKRRYGGAGVKSLGAIADKNIGAINNCFAYNVSYQNGLTGSVGALIGTGNSPINSYFYTASQYTPDSFSGCINKTAEQFADGTVTDLLNTDDKNFVQAESYPVLNGCAYSVTIDDTFDRFVEKGKPYTFNESDIEGFVAYNLGDDYFDEGDTFIPSENVSFKTISIGEFKMQKGASMRFNVKSGIRFYTSIDTNAVETLVESGATIQMGTLIAKNELLSDRELTFEVPEKENSNRVWANCEFSTQSIVNKNYYIQKMGSSTFTGIVGSLVDIKESNSNVNFVGRGYAIITIGDYVKTVYADYYNNDVVNNSRAISWIATQIKNDSQEYVSLSSSSKAIVDKYVLLYQ